MIIEDRLVNIETKIAYQEDMVQELSHTVYLQQKKIDRLEAICQSLIEHVKALSEAAEGKPGGNILDERPPHY